MDADADEAMLAAAIFASLDPVTANVVDCQVVSPGGSPSTGDLAMLCSLTGIDDVDQARHLLEAFSGDVTAAVNNHLNESLARENRRPAFPMAAPPYHPSPSALMGAEAVDDDIDVMDDLAYQPIVNMPQRGTASRYGAAFQAYFESLYGAMHPPMAEGTFDAAVRRAIQEAKLLLVFLHTQSVTPTIEDAIALFCSGVVANPGFSEVVSSNYVFWAADAVANADVVSHLLGARAEAHPQLFICGPGGSHEVEAARRASQADDNHPSEGLNHPLIAMYKLLCRVGTPIKLDGSTVPLCTDMDVDSVIIKLFSANDDFGAGLAPLREELQRRERDADLKNEQERAYQESLAADQRRTDDAARAGEQLRQQELETALAESIAEHRAEDVKMARERLQREFDKEPEPAVGEGVCTLTFRMPGGAKIERRFLSSCPLQRVLDFVESRAVVREQGMGTLRICVPFPKQVLDPATTPTLAAAGLRAGKVMLIVEDTDK